MLNKVQVKSDQYFNISYDNKRRWFSYYQQIEEIIKCSPSSILEVGKGNGFVSDYLKKRNFNIMTIDIDPELKPDKVADVTDIPYDSNSFDCVLCCEVLEHIPFDQFSLALKELKRVAKNRIILSLPDVSRKCRFLIQIPKVGEVRFLIPLPRLKKLTHQFDGEHYWEIGKKDFPLKEIIDEINKIEGLELIETYQLFENPYHRFFIIEKT